MSIKCVSPPAESGQHFLFSSHAFQKKNSENGRRQIKKVTRLLSSARDLDVQIASIEQYLGSLKPATKKRGS